MRTIVITDLDGTLLHSLTYTCEPAGPALRALQEREIPIVICSSKTRVEIERWRDRLKIDAPFIVENGGAICIPRNYFPFQPKASIQRNGYDIIEFGERYPEVVAALRSASDASGCQALGFHQMSVPEICLRTLLPVADAQLAKQREYDEPFEILGMGAHHLLSAIERGGKNWTRGDRMYHIHGHSGKAMAVKRLVSLYEQAYGGVRTIGVGNGHNDAEFLKCVDTPVIVRSRFSMALTKEIPKAVLTNSPGPFGWKEGILKVVTAGPVAA
jgi:mannosyl-3-phosphoglycerate phosphatase